MSCSFWTPSHDTVFVDCVAEWVESEAEKQEAWNVFHDTPGPLGWGPEGIGRLRDRAVAQLRSSPRYGSVRGVSR